MSQRQRWSSWASFAVAVAALALSVPWARAADEAPSPSRLLFDADSRVGQQSISFPRRPDDRQDRGPDKTQAPYFYVSGGDPNVDRLPLKETSARVDIAGVIARAKVRQVFENDGQKPIEAVYVFPGSTRAAVHGMRMKIGARTIEAKIDKKAQARQQYEEAKREGKRASLLEQERANVFTMSVANIMPKDRIEVELDYSELLVPEDATYEFVYPTVVGPRYAGGTDAKADKWIANPYLGEGQKEPFKFGIELHVEGGMAIKEIGSPSHKVAVTYQSKSSADVRLDQAGGGNKDFVLRYRLAGDKIETGLLLWKGEKENFFVMMMEPPQRPTAAMIPPREYIFLVDVSGSMHGFPLETSKALLKDLIGALRNTDFLNVVLFAGGSQTFSPSGSVPATWDNVKKATEFISRQQGGGGTELMAGLRQAYGVPRSDRGLSRTVIVATDGYVGVEAQAFKFIREHLNETNLFAFGIGTAVNRGLIEGMARAGQGETFVVLRPEKAADEAARFKKYVEQPVLAGIQVSFPGFAAYEVAPQKVPDLMARRPIVLFGKYREEPAGKIEVTGLTGQGKFSQAVEVTSAAVRAENAPIRFLWARRWVETLDDALNVSPGNKELEDGITSLGLRYTLLTRFTSFVAVDSEVANRTGQVEEVKQALPMPEGVSNLAVGGTGGMGLRSAQMPMKSAPRAMPAPEPKFEMKAKESMGKADSFGAVRRPSGAMGSGAAGNTYPAAFGTMDDGRGRSQLGRADRSPSPVSTVPASAPRPAEAAPSAADSAEPAMQAPSKDKVAAKAKRLVVDFEKPTNLSDLEALRKAIDEVLGKAISPSGYAPSRVRLLLTIDAAGKIVRIQILAAEGDAALSAELHRTLTNVASATKASGAESGTVVAIVTLL